MKQYFKYLLRHGLYMFLGLGFIYVSLKSREHRDSQDTLTFEQMILLVLLFLFIVTSKYYFLEIRKWKEKFREKYK